MPDKRSSVYLQRANWRGWVHYCDDGWSHVTKRDWRRWLRTFYAR